MNQQESRRKEGLTKGVVFVILGASSYGILATLVKISYRAGYTTAEVNLAQYAIGVFVLWLLNQASKQEVKFLKNDVPLLLLAGVCLGLTSVFYYISILFMNASIAVVFLMQSVWMGVLIEAVRDRVFPSIKKIMAVILVLAGTFLATGLIDMGNYELEFRGVLFGVLSGFFFSLALLSTNSVAVHLPALRRSLIMLYGGGIVVLLFVLLTQILPFYFNVNLVGSAFSWKKALDFSVFWKWGFPIALFGTVVPPLLFNKGFPLTGVGLGSILSSIELPVSIACAYFVLGETINSVQWMGVSAILIAVVVLNMPFPAWKKKG